MKIEISIEEIEQLIKHFYHVNVLLRIIDENRLKVTYWASLVLSFNKVGRDELFFNYEANGLVNILAKAIHHFEKDKLADMPLSWNSDTREVSIDLKKIKELNSLLNMLDISGLRIADDKISMTLRLRNIEGEIEK
ncbi:MAG: hypothetical protein WC699_14910 [Bacteroidales bacterium]|jgi:hypothetical protein